MNKNICRACVRLAGIAVCLGAGIALCASAAGAQASSPAALRVDEMMTPLGIDDAQPRFSWQLRDSRQGARQSAYRLLVATQPELLAVGHADVWDSGRVASGQSVGVPYAGPALAPSTRYYWKVLVWDQEGKPAPESPVSWWETGLLKQPWRAQWIGYETRGRGRGAPCSGGLDCLSGSNSRCRPLRLCPQENPLSSTLPTGKR